MTEFIWLTMCDLIDIRKSKFLEKISKSGNSLCQVIVNTQCVIRDNCIRYGVTLYSLLFIY